MGSNTVNVSDAFSKQAPVFDKLSNENKLSEFLRSKFRQEVLSDLKPQSTILELNCGTGLDAVFFAEKGHLIHATDNAEGMISQLKNKITDKGLEAQITAERLSYHDLHRLKGKTFDRIVSNFGGLNCTDNLKDVLLQLSPLLNDGGKVILMIMPRVCPWEILMLVKGRFKTAFRRFRKNTPAHIEGVHFSCYYYNPGYVIKVLKKEFKLINLKGIFITLPPEFYQNFVEKHPGLFSFLSKTDDLIGSWFPFTHWCDHYLITLQKK